MMPPMELLSHLETIIIGVLGSATLLGFILYRRATQRIKDADGALS